MQQPPKHGTCAYPGCGQPVRYLRTPQAYVHMAGIQAHATVKVADHDAVVSTVESTALFDAAEVAPKRMCKGGCGWDLDVLGPPMGATTIPDLDGYCGDCYLDAHPEIEEQMRASMPPLPDGAR